MNPEVKKKWIEALKSREYDQGVGGLCVGDRFCCLGVLCDLHARETNKAWDHQVGIERGAARYCGCRNYLPQEVMEWAGLKSENPVVGGNDRQALANLNDGGYSFSSIANLIEENL